MKPMKIIVLIFLVLVSYTCWGQFTALNKYYHISVNNYTKIIDIICKSDTLIILGEIYQDTIPNKQNVYLAKLDTFGNIIEINYFFDPLGKTENLINIHAKLSKTKDGGFVFTSGPFSRNSNFFFFKIRNI